VRISCQRLRVTSPDGRTLLQEVSLSTPHGAFVAVIGPSGTGKTTLLKVLAGVLPGDEDTVVFYDDILAHDHRRRHGGQIGYVPQDDIVPSELTAERALYYSACLRLPRGTSGRLARARVDEVLAELDIAKRGGIRVRDLSGGQRKRVSIGAELLARPRVLFLDEPTAGLDPALEASLIDDFARQCEKEGRTIVMVTHAAEAVARRCTRLVVLAEGGDRVAISPTMARRIRLWSA
jgi:ABC transport system ATP-binding/permease protein